MRFLFVLSLALCSALPATAQVTDRGNVASPADTPTVFDNPSLVQQYQATITADDLASHLYVFASDYFEGRETSTRGQKLAATYLAGQYRKMGAMPRGTMATDDAYAPANYFQEVPLYGRRLANADVSLTVDGEEVAAHSFGPGNAGNDLYLAFGNRANVSTDVVFGGYGLEDDELGYNDFSALEAEGIDVQGKWLMVFRDEPMASAEESLLPTEDGGLSRWSQQGGSKLRNLFQKGVGGVLIVGDVGPREDGTVAERAARTASGQQGVGQLSLNEPGGGFAIMPFYVISSEFANQILAPTGQTVADLQGRINASLTPEVFAVPEATVISEITYETYPTSTENVMAFIEGSDPELRDEVVVISSHYDHIGINPALSGDTINNGADDDGSGTVAVLEMAEAFIQAKRDGYGPRRSILFLNVSGEEKGLLGSAYFSDIEPVVPLENIVTNLNIDMIGRFDPSHPSGSENYVYIIGSNLISQELHDINLRVNDVTGTTLELDERFNSKDDPNRFYARSDHWNFGKHGIPFIFFFTGTHDDYHQPGDEAHKIEYERMTRITQLVFATAWQVANQDQRPAVSGEGFN